MVPSLVRLVFAALAVVSLQHSILATPAAAQSTMLTGWWAGVAPDSGLTYDDGTCSQEVTFVLQQQGDVITGDLVAASTTSGACQPLRSVEQNGNLFSASEIGGSLSAGVLAIRIVRVRTFNGVPNQVLAVVATGTSDSERLTIAGNLVGARAWIDLNRDFIPDCDLGLQAANGECGPAPAPTPISLSAVRLDSPSFLLDFETTATGADILSVPFASPDGTVTATADGGSLVLLVGSVGTGTFLLHDQADEASDDSGQLAFDFDVSSITLNYDGFSAGELLMEVLDANLNVIGSFFDPDTSPDRPGGPITLSAPGIRYFRWRDTDPDRVSAGIDNVSVSVALPSSVEQIHEIVDIVASLTANGVIGGGTAQSLNARLLVAASLATTNPNGAVGVLTSFIQQVNSLVRRGILTAAQGQTLVAAAQEAIAAL